MNLSERLYSSLAERLAEVIAAEIHKEPWTSEYAVIDLTEPTRPDPGIAERRTPVAAT